MLRGLGLRYVHRLGRTCTVRPGAGSGLSGVVPRGEGRLSCTAFLQGDARWSQSWRCTTVRGFTAARAKTVKPKEAQRVVVPPVDPLNVLDASDARPTKEELKEMLQAGGGVSSWQATAVTEWSERWAELDEEADRRQLLFSEGLSVLDRVIGLVREHGARKKTKGDDVFTPQLAARLVYALARDVRFYSGPERARVRECGAQVVPLVLSDEGRGLKKLTAHELARLAIGTARLSLSDCPPVSTMPRQVEVECLRRGLDNFKAADLADLLSAWRTWKYKPGKELAEAVQERVMRRGYLTKGRGGQTSPEVVVRLLNRLLLSRQELQLQPAVVNRFLEVIMLEGFTEPLGSRDLVFTMVTVRQGHPMVSERDREVLAGRIMRQLVSHMEGWAGQEAYDPSVAERWLKLLSQLTREEFSPEVLAVSRRLIEAWAAAVEGGHHDISEPQPFFVQLKSCYIKQILGVEGTEHIAKVLNEELARLLRADGCSCYDSNSAGLMGVFYLWRHVSFYPGHDLMDMMVDRILSMGGMGHSGWTEFVGLVVQHAEQVHAYKPKGGFADRMLEVLRLAPLKSVHDLAQMCASIEILSMSASASQAQQPVVNGFIRHIGDSKAFVKRVCGGSHRASLNKLNRALDLLKKVASGGDVASKGGEDGD